MREPVLNIESVSHWYSQDNLILDAIDLDIYKGERFALIGPSGCGKSTLLRLIAGLEKPKEGIIRIRNEIVSDSNKMTPPEKRNLGLVVQEKALFPHMTVRDNITFGIRKTKKRNDIAFGLLKLFKIEALKDKFPHEISGGEQQRVALARSMAPEPNLLMLDEPFNALDQDLKAELYLEISRIFSEKKVTLLLVTHDIDEASILTHKQINLVELRKPSNERNSFSK